MSALTYVRRCLLVAIISAVFLVAAAVCFPNPALAAEEVVKVSGKVTKDPSLGWVLTTEEGEKKYVIGKVEGVYSDDVIKFLEKPRNYPTQGVVLEGTVERRTISKPSGGKLSYNYLKLLKYGEYIKMQWIPLTQYR